MTRFGKVVNFKLRIATPPASRHDANLAVRNGFGRPNSLREVTHYIISQSRLGGLGLCDGVVCMWYMRGGHGYVVRSVRKDGCCEYTYESSVVCKL